MLDKRKYLSHYWSDKGFKGIIVNQALSSLHGGSIKIKLQVSLSLIFNK